MNWRTHLTFSMLGAVALFLFGLWLGQALINDGPLTMFFTGAALAITWRFAFRALVTATCPACDRPGARQAGSRPITYECEACGHSHDTGFSEGHRSM